MQFKHLSLLLVLVFSLTFVSSAETWKYNYLDQGEEVQFGANYSINVNNTEHFDGYNLLEHLTWLKNTLIPYTGATTNVDLGSKNITANTFIGDGSQLTGIDIPDTYWNKTSTILTPKTDGDNFGMTSITENQVNGDFATLDFTGWTPDPSGEWSASTGSAVYTGGSGGTLTGFIPTIGEHYKVSYEWSNLGGGDVPVFSVSFGGISIDPTEDTSGSGSFYIVATTTTPLSFYFGDDEGGDGTYGTIDNVKVETANKGVEVTGAGETIYKGGEISGDSLYLNVDQLEIKARLGNLIPLSNKNLGSSSYRWNTIYSSWLHTIAIYGQDISDKIVISSNAISIYRNGVLTTEFRDTITNFKKDTLHLDNIKSYFGTGADSSIYYDGTDLNINPQEVGSGQLQILGDTNTTGIVYEDITSKAYAQMDYHNETNPLEITLTTEDLYYNITDLHLAFNNSIYMNGQATITKTNMYHLTGSISFSGGNSGLYRYNLFVNNVEEHACGAMRSTSSNAIGSMSINCLVYLEDGDTVNMRVKDTTSPVQDVDIYTLTFNMVEI